MKTLVKVIALILIALTTQSSLFERNDEKYQIEIKTVNIFPSACSSFEILESYKEIYLYLYFKELVIDESTKYDVDISATTYNIKDSPVDAETRCRLYSSYSYIYCNITSAYLGIGRYYVKLEPSEGNEWIFSGYSTKSNPFEIRENNINFFMQDDKSNEYYYSLHGKKNDDAKEDYLTLIAFKNFTSSEEIPEISVLDGDKKIKIPCTFSEFENSIIKCDVNGLNLTPNKQLWLDIPTKCTGLTDKVPYFYNTTYYPIINIKSYSLDRKCAGKEEYLTFHFEFEELQGTYDRSQYYRLYNCIRYTGNDESYKYLNSISMNWCEFSGTNSITCAKTLYNIDKNSIKSLVNVQSCMAITKDDTIPIIIRPFLFKNAFMINNETVNPDSDSYNHYIDYNKDGYREITITFRNSIQSGYIPTLKINNNELSCDIKDNSLTCLIDSREFPGYYYAYKYYKGELTTGCGDNYKNTIGIYVRNMNWPGTYIYLKNPQFEKSCHIYRGLTQQDIRFTLEYDVHYYSNSSFSMKNFDIDMVLLSDTNKNFSSTCVVSSAEKLFRCYFPDNSVKDLPSGSYRPTLKNGLNLVDHIIYQSTSEKSIYLANEDIPKPVEPLSEGKVVLNAEFSGSISSTNVLIKFEKNLKDDFIPTIVVNDKVLACGKMKKLYLSCLILKDDFPAGTYSGEMKNVCDEKMIEITLITDGTGGNKDSETNATSNKGLIAGVVVLAVIVAGLIGVLVLMRINRKKYIDSKMMETIKLDEIKENKENNENNENTYTIY